MEINSNNFSCVFPGSTSTTPVATTSGGGTSTADFFAMLGPSRNRSQTWGGHIRPSPPLHQPEEDFHHLDTITTTASVTTSSLMDDDDETTQDALIPYLPLDYNEFPGNNDENLCWSPSIYDQGGDGGYLRSVSGGGPTSGGYFAMGMSTSPAGDGSLVFSGGAGGMTGSPGSIVIVNGKKTSRRNPWGQETYADMIARAIEGAPGKRATLQQIYEYIALHYPYFKDRSDPTSSAGWKNSIRHNLSLHDKFVKCAKSNDNAKSCFWTVNHEAPRRPYMRRRASSMDAKKALETAKKAVAARKKSAAAAAGSQRVSNTESPFPLDLPESTDLSGPPLDLPSTASTSFYRQRSGSNVSTFSTVSQASRLSDSPLSVAPPPPSTTYITNEEVVSPLATEQLPASAKQQSDMDRVSQELCLEVVRRIVFGEDEADLLACGDDNAASVVASAAHSNFTSSPIPHTQQQPPSYYEKGDNNPLYHSSSASGHHYHTSPVNRNGYQPQMAATYHHQSPTHPSSTSNLIAPHWS